MPKSFKPELPASAGLLSSNEHKFDDLAFEVLFRENFSGLCIYCQVKFDFDLDLAKEAVHTGFIKLWETRSTLSPGLPVKPYLLKIITNVSYDILKHEKVKQKHDKHVLGNSGLNCNRKDYDKAEYNELRFCIDKAVSELPEQMRTIFEMSRYEGLKYAEISSRLTISVKTVETQMSRALVKLRHKLSDYLPVYLGALLIYSNT